MSEGLVLSMVGACAELLSTGLVLSMHGWPAWGLVQNCCSTASTKLSSLPHYSTFSQGP